MPEIGCWQAITVQKGRPIKLSKDYFVKKKGDTFRHPPSGGEKNALIYILRLLSWKCLFLPAHQRNIPLLVGNSTRFRCSRPDPLIYYLLHSIQAGQNLQLKNSDIVKKYLIRLDLNR